MDALKVLALPFTGSSPQQNWLWPSTINYCGGVYSPDATIYYDVYIINKIFVHDFRVRVIFNQLAGQGSTENRTA